MNTLKNSPLGIAGVALGLAMVVMLLGLLFADSDGNSRLGLIALLAIIIVILGLLAAAAVASRSNEAKPLTHEALEYKPPRP